MFKQSRYFPRLHQVQRCCVKRAGPAIDNPPFILHPFRKRFIDICDPVTSVDDFSLWNKTGEYKTGGAKKDEPSPCAPSNQNAQREMNKNIDGSGGQLTSRQNERGGELHQSRRDAKTRFQHQALDGRWLCVLFAYFDASVHRWPRIRR